MQIPSFEQLTGRDQSHLQKIIINDYEILVHPLIIKDLQNWEDLCQKSSIDFAVASAFRSFERQKLIWNEKVEGKRIVNDEFGNPLDTSKLNEQELLQAIMLWSHVPGASRHHWGTDLDIYDASWFKQNNQKLDLQNKLFLNGPCQQLHLLNEELIQQGFNFFRPYDQNANFQTELWHYSHYQVAEIFHQNYTLEVFKQNLQNSHDLLLKDQLLTDAEMIYRKFIA